jgi:hypothetical protein
MDPIHPIIPVRPNIPPVTPAPLIGGVDRDGRQRDTSQQNRRRRPPSPVPADVHEHDGEDDSGLHVDVTA